MDSQNQKNSQQNNFNPRYLQQILDKAKSELFLDDSLAFLTQVMAGQEFVWDTEVKDMNVTPNEIHFNPSWFDNLSEKDRVYNLRHGLWRVGLMHEFRRGLRDRKLWDEACNHHVNLLLSEEGLKTSNMMVHADPAYKGLSEEEIYSKLEKRPPQEDDKPKQGNKPSGSGKMPVPFCSTSSPDSGNEPDSQMSDSDVSKQLQRLNDAAMATGMSKEAGNVPGNIQKLLDQFVQSKLPWQGLLVDFFTEIGDKKRSWRRRNRRYRHIYMPSWIPEEDGLAHLVWAIDCSGSTTDHMVTRCNSEIKHIFDTFNVKKITIILFDTVIQDVIVYEQGDDFDKIHIKGRGGTSFTKVRQFLMDNKPTAAVIFSDMYCRPMEPLPKEYRIPLLWIAIDRKPGTVKVNDGKVIYFEE